MGVAILAVLVAVVLGNFTGLLSGSQSPAASAELQIVRTAGVVSTPTLTPTPTPTPTPNEPPVANGDSATTAVDTEVTIDVLANDSDANGDPLTVTAVVVPLNGSAAISGGGTTITYTPNLGFSGDDSFTYTIGTATATVSITVAALSNLPNAAASSDLPDPAAPGSLPNAGGTPSDRGSGTLPWPTVIAGVLALMGGGSGLWMAYWRWRVR